MDRKISPPPSKRRKTSTQKATTNRTVRQPPPPTNSDTMRLFSWNINGIAPFLQKPITSFFAPSNPPSSNKSKPTVTIPPASLRGFLYRHDWPAVLFLQEVKIGASDEKTQDAVRKAVSTRVPEEDLGVKRGPMYQAHFTLPNDPYNARGLRGSGKVYGVCSIVRADLFSNYKANVRTVDWDKEGRVSIVELTSLSSKFALFNIYAVNGTDNPYRDPSKGTIRGTRHDRKLAFHRQLMGECLALERDHWNVVLAGDMNVAPTLLDGYPRLRDFPHQHVINRADFNAKFLGVEREPEEEGFQGVDVWREKHTDERRYTYYSRGREWGSNCDRVDYAIVGRKMWDEELVAGAGILDTEAERGPSDHVPIWVDIKLGESSLVIQAPS
jgi:exonuclease III